jgi:hypothetical protein
LFVDADVPEGVHLTGHEKQGNGLFTGGNKELLAALELLPVSDLYPIRHGPSRYVIEGADSPAPSIN